MPTASASAVRRSVTGPPHATGILISYRLVAKITRNGRPGVPPPARLSEFASLSRRVPRSSTFRRDDRFVKIVRLANYVAPASGGLRTALAELGAGYLAAGHEPVLIVPGDRDSDERTAQGRVITLRAPRLPFTGGYRALWCRRRVERLLASLRPDTIEVSDRTTLRWTGRWAREHGVPAIMVSHESITALFRLAP